MQSSSRQLSTITDSGSDNQQGENFVHHVPKIPAARKFAGASLECFLLADTNAGLHSDIQSQVRCTSNTPECLVTTGDNVLQVGLVTLLQNDQVDDQRNELLMSAAASMALPVVLVTNDPVAARRSPLPANIVDIVENDTTGAGRLRETTTKLAANVHQKIWLVGQFDDYTGLLFRNLGYQVSEVDQLSEIDFADECANLRASATLVVLNSAGARSYHDYDKFPIVLSQALQGNEFFSMITLLDAHSSELKQYWQQLGATALDSRTLLEHELLDLVRTSLARQHRLVTLQYDAVRDTATGIYNANYLEDTGRRLHAAAARGELSFAVVVLQIRASRSLAGTRTVEIVEAMNEVLLKELRISDVIAQRFPEELVCLISSAERYALASSLERVCDSLQCRFEEQFGLEFPLAIGATAERGASFDAMMHRATMAALQCHLPDNGIVVIL